MFNQEQSAQSPTSLSSPMDNEGASPPGRGLGKGRRHSAFWRMVVVDDCHYGRMGLVSALNGTPWGGRKLRVTGVKDLGAMHVLRATVGVFDESRRLECLVVRLPADPQAALSTLLQLGAPGLSMSLTAHLVVLSALPPSVVLRVLSRIGVKVWVRVVDDRLPLAALCQAVCAQGELPEMRTMAWSGQLLANLGVPQLSVKERGVLWQCLQMVSVEVLARRQKMSSKTLYTQRQGAVHKLGAAHLKALLKQFRVLPGNV